MADALIVIVILVVISPVVYGVGYLIYTSKECSKKIKQIYLKVIYYQLQFTASNNLSNNPSSDQAPESVITHTIISIPVDSRQTEMENNTNDLPPSYEQATCSQSSATL